MEQQHLKQDRTSVRRRTGVALQMQDGKTTQPVGRVMNLSEDGFMLLTKQQINPNEKHDLVLNLPEAIGPHHSIELVGECRWCHPSNLAGYFGAGFTLVSVNIMKRDAWKQFAEQF